MNAFLNRELKWVQPSALKHEYQLRAGEEVIATVRFRSIFGTFATAESADGCWTFKRVGFWQTRATVRICGSDADIAVFRNNTWSGGGTLQLSDGRAFRATTNLWQDKLEIQSGSGEALLRFKSEGLLHKSAQVEVQPAAAELSELPWIVMLGWYLIVMMQNDAAAASATAAAG